MKYVIGVDGGGTKTEAVAFNELGEEIASGRTGFSNMIEHPEQGLNNIESAIMQCMKDLNMSDCIHIYAGISGVEIGNSKELIENRLSNSFNTSITVINDADLALYSLLKGEDGIITISGTGSISLGVHNNKYFRAGGWGKLLGDEGSGYDIAIRALKQIVKEQDDGLESSALSKEILRYINCLNAFDMVKFANNANKSDIAAITPIIAKATEKNDEDALNILKAASKDLVNITMKVYKKLDFSSNIKIGIRGSILTKIPTIKESFTKYIAEEIDDFIIVDEDVSSSKGGYYLAKKNLEF